MCWLLTNVIDAYNETVSKTAVITGASSGIGNAIAHQLASEGYNLSLNYFGKAEKVEEIVSQFEKYGNEVIVIHSDISTSQGRDAFINHTVDHFSSIDVLVNNAGIYMRTSFSDLSVEAYEKTLGVNLTGALFLTQGFLSSFNENSSIVFMSSINAFVGSDHGIDYNISKAGIIAIARSLAIELAPKVRVNAIAPGSIDTLLISSDTRTRRDERVSEQLIKRLGTPQDVANMVSYLVSNKASFVTGQTFHVNGGKYFS